MGDKRPYKPRKPGAGRKPLKPDYNAAAILQEQIQTAVVLYEEDNSLQTIADILEYDLHKPNFLNWLYMNAE